MHKAWVVLAFVAAILAGIATMLDYDVAAIIAAMLVVGCGIASIATR